ncbi:MAG: DUF2892 domain-containing protein [Candidatus Pacebacteria bacterium]|nr:DUF2892 domain-containing protein [Candidatus Paceibacterota bacterium]
MKKNEGPTDRIIRIIIGLTLITIAYTQQINWLYVVGAVALITGITGFCGLYKLMGKNTCPKKK